MVDMAKSAGSVRISARIFMRALTFALSGAPPWAQANRALLIGASALERAVRGHRSYHHDFDFAEVIVKTTRAYSLIGCTAYALIRNAEFDLARTITSLRPYD